MEERTVDPLEGQLIDGRYRVRRRLARGGMSTVYLATDERLHRDVALKALYPYLAEDQRVVRRFEEEAITAAKLSHPHVVNVLDQGVDGDTAYLVMEYLKGKTLRHVLEQQGRLTPRQALKVLEEILDGLAAAHSAGLVHRDMKPENVLLTETGRVKVADFGLARAASNHTQSGTLVGTVAYVSPELVTGGKADKRSDLYAIGIMLFEMLTGDQPFRGESSMSIAFKHVSETVPPPSRLIPELSQDLDELVEWCTAKDPEARPVDASALLGELRHVRAALSEDQLDLGAAEIATSQKNYDAAAAAAAPVSVDRDVEEKFAGYWDDSEQAPSYSEEADVDEDATTVIPTHHNETQAFSRLDEPDVAPNQYTEIIDAHDIPAHETGEISAVTKAAPAPRPLSPAAAAKQAKKDAKIAQREWKRDAQKPLVNLDKKGSRVRRWILAIVLVMLVALVAAAGWFFGLGPGAPVSLPSVSGQTVAQATQTLDNVGVAARPKEVFSDDVERGLVVGTEPSDGTTIRRFEGADLLVSKGPELFEVPKLAQLTTAEANEQLDERSLALGKVTEEYSETIDDGKIVEQSVNVGTQVRRGTAINVTVSKGPAPVAVPDLSGMTVEEASAALEEIGLSLTEDGEEFSAKVPAGDVSSQGVKTGEKVNRGTEIPVTVSKGPRMVEVPRVVGQQLDEASATLEELGFKVEVKYPLGNIFGTVHGQSVFGEEVPEGSTIVLTVV
ncbi:protein kinase domain-containing protein [Neomicrococcus lactis]|uniref:non-specific serine/threonine protein kinase n=1 Tax=Neomicrococcus lactis TaxID=732241 RepID=A0A7W9DAQ7_9MICC|nr:serine/threonine-protein kinase [Neomicrococcus lactis]